MAKIRIYELAKDLNMTNKALLDKLRELQIEVKSHMSSLEDSDVAKVKKDLFGKSRKTVDVKVRPSVIRRRKKVVKEDIEPEAADEEETEDTKALSDEPEETRPVVRRRAKKTDVKADENKEEVTAQPSEPTEETPEETADETEPEPAAVPRKKKVKKAASARIVKPVAADESESETVDQKDIDDSESVENQAVETDTQPEDEAVSKTEEETAPATDEAVKTSETTAADDQLPVEEPVKTIKKKKKKSTPAKIVKVVDPSVLENLKKSRPADDRKKPKRGGKPSGDKKSFKSKAQEKAGSIVLPDIDIASMGDPASGDDKWKKDKRKSRFDGDGPEPAQTFGKRKKRKKKSVIEGAALYKGGRGRKKRGKRDQRGKKAGFQQTQITTPKAIKRRIKVDDAIELAELAKRMGIKANEMIAKLMTMGVMATVNQTIDYDTASLVATEFGFEAERAAFEEETLLNIPDDQDDEESMVERAPVVTIMGHVDHGKTSLLDVIRESKITSGEAGGITQHIGAYNVETPNGGRISFLDTPGHAAFTAMRSRGASVTDIVILVVAADDGVMPQTIEAINHSKAAGVPVVVAVNKMDKEGADPDRVMRELSEYELLAEDWGGDTIFVKVSAKTGEGIDELLEMILLQSEVLELKANPDRNASGYVVESRLDVGRGSVATVLVKQGTLKDGDSIVCGLHSGKIRAMIDDGGERIDSAGPSMPVEIVGLNGVPNAGDEFISVATDKDAKQIAAHRMQKQRAKELAKKSRANLEKMFENLGSAEVKELKLIVKADVQGSIEALNDSLKDLAKEEVEVKIVHSGTGTINDSDVSLAAVSDAIIIGFNVRPAPQIRVLAKEENVDMRFYDIIYDVINDIKTALEGMMPSTFHENIIGLADVKDIFVIPKMGTIAGCQISQGKVIRGKNVRLLRDGVIKKDTQISSLRRFKDDVKEVEQGFECGIGLEKFNDIKVGDVIECYEVEERKYKSG